MPGPVRVIVSDASVLFDLADAALVLDTFRLPYDFQIPDVMFFKELLDLGDVSREDLTTAGLSIVSFDGVEVSEAVALRGRYPALSSSDAFALLLARREAAILLTGDRRLRNAATTEAVQRHGHLWLIEQLRAHRLVSRVVLRRVLNEWKTAPAVRLPDRDIDALITRLR